MDPRPSGFIDILTAVLLWINGPQITGAPLRCEISLSREVSQVAVGGLASCHSKQG